MLKNYRGATIPDCPNLCYEKLIDREIDEHTVGGFPPRFMSGGGYVHEWRMRRYSVRLKRWGERNTVGSRIAPMNFCPICGARLRAGRWENDGTDNR